MLVDITRARVTHPSGIASPARFVFHSENGDNIGTAAVWQEDRRHRSASRVLFASSARYEPGKTPRHQSTLHFDDGTFWSISPLSGGCSCRKRDTLLASFSPPQLLEESVESLT